MSHPYPGDSFGGKLQQAFNALYAEAGQVPDNQLSCVWVFRTGWDIGAGMEPDAAAAKHLAECREALGLTLPFPPAPTREQVCGVRCSFQGVAVDLPGFGTVRNPGGFAYSLDRAGRDACRAVSRQLRDTHVLRNLSYAYSEQDFTYPIPAGDFTNRLDEFHDLLVEDIREGFTPLVCLSGDGQRYNPDGGTYGFQWLLDNMPRLAAALDDLRHHLIVFWGFELITNGGWTPANFEEATLKWRNLWPDGHIACHIGTYTWWGDADQNEKRGPVGVWSSPAGLAIDTCLEEGDAGWIREDGSLVPGDALNGWEQRAMGHLRNPNRALISPANQAKVFEWPDDTPRGPRMCVAWEILTFDDTRGRVSVQLLAAARHHLRQLGFPYVG